MNAKFKWPKSDGKWKGYTDDPTTVKTCKDRNASIFQNCPIDNEILQTLNMAKER